MPCSGSCSRCRQGWAATPPASLRSTAPSRRIRGRARPAPAWTTARCSKPACSIPVTRVWPSCRGSSTRGPTCSNTTAGSGWRRCCNRPSASPATAPPSCRWRPPRGRGSDQELRHDGACATFLRDGRAPAPLGRFANPALRTSPRAGRRGRTRRVLSRRHRRVDRAARSRPPAVCCRSRISASHQGEIAPPMTLRARRARAGRGRPAQRWPHRAAGRRAPAPHRARW